MSIRVMNRVWEHAEYKESTLLILLALADFADDNGICWPEVPTLAAKARVSDRRAIDIIQALEKDGAIVYQRGGGRGKRSLYGVLVGLTDEQKERVKLFHRNYFSENKTVKLETRKGELQRKERVNYSVNSRKGLEQQDAPNPDPIRHEIRHVDPSGGEKQKNKPLDELSHALFDLCMVDPDLASQAVLAQLRKTYKSLRDKEVTQGDVRERFAAYWYSDDNWMARKAREAGRNPEPPTPKQVLDDWTRAMAWKPAKSPPKARQVTDLPLIQSSGGPTPEERRAAAERRKAMMNERATGK